MADSAPERVRDLVLPLGAPIQQLRALAAQALGVPADSLAEVRPTKVSLDARGPVPKRVYTVEVWRLGEDVPPDEAPHVALPTDLRPLVVGEAPIVVGTGPAGLWAALRCVEAGQPVILLDRGGGLESRNHAVAAMRRRGILDPESNLCFGEGGAGTYSDGKLYTRVRDPRVRRVIRDMVAFGGQRELLIEAHPHVGTNRLIRVLRRIRAHLESAGCVLQFGACVTDLLRLADGSVGGVRLQDGTELSSRHVIFATGHSARDTLTMLRSHGVEMEPKALAVGLRLEHPQALIDRIQYGHHGDHPALGAARYALTSRVGKRGIYSFCMCPGGFVIPTPAEPQHLNVNGMSNSNRGSPFANAALVVTVEPEDFWIDQPGDLADHGSLAGVQFQRHLERIAYLEGGGDYVAPAQRLTDFLRGRLGDLPPRTSYRPGLQATDLRRLLPERLLAPLCRAIPRFEQKLPGFLTQEAVLMGTETTTSSPVRILRRVDRLDAPGVPGLYPCGEGAGAAGGIVSSAIDGIRVADGVLTDLGVAIRS